LKTGRKGLPAKENCPENRQPATTNGSPKTTQAPGGGESAKKDGTVMGGWRAAPGEDDNYVYSIAL